MRETRETPLALRALQLLLDDARPEADVPWDDLALLARRHGVLIRLAGRFERLGIRPAAVFETAVARERRRVAAMIDLMRRVGDACASGDIDFIFPKALHLYPDMGGDLDLLVLSHSTAVDRVILRHLPAALLERDLRHRVANVTVYHVEGFPSILDIHHGRLGVLGEYRALPALLLQHRQPASVGGLPCFVPSREDQVLLQGLERVPGRRSLRLADVVFAHAALRPGLDWNYVLRTARALGGVHTLSCYLSYVDQVYQRCFAGSLVPPEVRSELALKGWGRVSCGSAGLQFPALRANALIYLRQFDAMMESWNWSGAGRLLLLPVVAAAAGWARLGARGQ